MRHPLLITCLLAASVPTWSQTQIKCVQDLNSGRYTAPIGWQNTLGIERANALCAQADALTRGNDNTLQQRAEIKANALPLDRPNDAGLTKRFDSTTASNALEFIRANNQMQLEKKGRITTFAETAPSFQKRYLTSDGEKVSESLTRWADSNGYGLLWEASEKADLIMKSASMESAEFRDLVAETIFLVNARITQKNNQLLGSDKKTRQIEAVFYSNKVVRILEKESSSLAEVAKSQGRTLSSTKYPVDISKPSAVVAKALEEDEMEKAALLADQNAMKAQQRTADEKSASASPQIKGAITKQPAQKLDKSTLRVDKPMSESGTDKQQVKTGYWDIQNSGNSLKRVIETWSSKAGVKLNWSFNDDYLLTEEVKSSTYSGSFKDALVQLATKFGQLKTPLAMKFENDGSILNVYPAVN